MAARDFPPGYLDQWREITTMATGRGAQMPSEDDLVHFIKDGITEPNEMDEYGLTYCSRIIRAYLTQPLRNLCQTCARRAAEAGVKVTAQPGGYDGVTDHLMWPSVQSFLDGEDPLIVLHDGGVL